MSRNPSTRSDKDVEVVPRGAIALMTIVTLWSGVLAVGFGYAAANTLRSGQAVLALVYVALSAFLAIVAVRTTIELARRRTRGSHRQ